MRIMGNIWRGIRRFRTDRSGNFAITTAILLPVMIGAVGVALDLANVIQFKYKLQASLDSAALAAASSMAAKEKDAIGAKALAAEVLAAQMSVTENGKTKDPDPYFDPTQVAPPLTTINTVSPSLAVKEYTVDLQVAYNFPLSGLSRVLGMNSVVVNAKSRSFASTESKSALSMYFVLDRSGSMGQPTSNTYQTVCTNSKGVKYQCSQYYTKMQSLQIAAGTLFTTLAEADPANKYVRTGAVSYNNVMQTPTNLAWGTTAAKTYVNALTASGTTNSAPGMNQAYLNIMLATENAAHLLKNGQAPAKYIVLMTDGENNVANADSSTKTTCDLARVAKIEVYTIAFMAPVAGQNLLKYCATDAAHYFDAQDTTELINAFKSIGDRASQQMTRLTN